MTDNLYFLFLDEIYAPNLNDMLRFRKDEINSQSKHFHFGISGVIVAASCLKDLMKSSERVKHKYYPKINNLIFHYVDILNNKDIYSDLFTNSKKSLSFKTSLSNFARSSDFKYDYVFVDKNELIKKFGVFDKKGRVTKIQKIGSNLFPRSPVHDYNLYLLCLRKMVENFYSFLTRKKFIARGVIVAEARGEREDTELREAFKKIYYNGVGSIKPTDLRRQILELFIVPKKQNYFGTQLADLVLYPTYDGVIPNHNARPDHFILFGRDLKKKVLDKSSKIIP